MASTARYVIVFNDETVTEAKRKHQGFYRSRYFAKKDAEEHKKEQPKGSKYRIMRVRK